ncbi:MAG: RNA 2',3'-cyclic phosphodiesterase [archaeon]
MTRLFVAIEIPDELKKRIFEEMVKPLNGLKSVKEENLHATLCFMEDEKESEIIEKLRKIKGKTFEADITQTGHFGDRVIWVGIESDEFEGLYEKVHEALRIKTDHRFSGHITLARGNDSGNFFKEFLKIRDKSIFESFLIEKITLFRSVLTKNGPVYEKVEDFYLEE